MPSRGAIASAAPGAKVGNNEEDKCPTFDHPTWAVKHLVSISNLSEVSRDGVNYQHLLVLRKWSFQGIYYSKVDVYE